MVQIRGAVASCLILASCGWFLPAVCPAQTTGSPDTAARAAATGPTTLGAVTVAGVRVPARVAIGNPQPEVQLDPAEIESYGASTVQDLLAAIAPLTSSVAGRGSGDPVVLLNGRRISGMEEVRSIPAEAIIRIDVLPEEESLQYGFPPDQKVVNVVLRPQFHSLTGQLDGSRPTEGGQDSGSVDLNEFKVRDDDRINLDLRYSGSSALNEAARNPAPVPTTPPYDIVGNVVSASPGGQIDPALSVLAGESVNIAGVPSGLGGRAPTLADFAATAGQANAGDINSYRTFAPASQSLAGTAVWSRALGNRISATVNASATVSKRDSLLGLPGVGLTVPAGDPFSPFASDVVLDRYIPGALGRQQRDWTAYLGGILVRDTDRWHLSLTGSYYHGDSRTITDSGVDTQQAQALLDALSPGFDPFGPVDATLFPRLAPDLAHSSNDYMDVHGQITGPLAQLPAGPLLGSLSVRDTGTWIGSRSRIMDLPTAVQLNRNDAGVRANLELPFACCRRAQAAAAQAFTLTGNAGVDALSDFGVLSSWGYGIRWSPFKAVTLSVTATHDQVAPSLAQLGNPTVTTAGVRWFDFATGQTLSVTSVNGGNAGLSSDQRRQLRAGLTVRPFQDRQLTLVGSYVDSRLTNPILGLPVATAQLQAALPDRFILDGDGNVLTVDNRPLNFAAQSSRRLRWGFNDSRPIGDWFGTGPSGPLQSGAGRLVISLYHTVFLEDRLQVRSGGLVMDLLDGGALGSMGGQVRHQVDGSLGYSRDSLGVRLEFSWHGGTRIQGGLPVSDLGFSALATANLTLFANLGEMPALHRWRPWLDGARLSLTVTNLFDQRIGVMDGDAQTPPIYQSAYLDPVGRLISLSLRKQVR